MSRKRKKKGKERKKEGRRKIQLEEERCKFFKNAEEREGGIGNASPRRRTSICRAAATVMVKIHYPPSIFFFILILFQSVSWRTPSILLRSPPSVEGCCYSCTRELGASSVTPLLTEHSPSISENRADRLQRVTLAAAKQGQRLHEMSLNPPTTIDSLLPIVTQSKLSLVAVAEAIPVISVLTSQRKESSGLIVIGP